MEFFGDLDEKQASQFIDKLDQESLNHLRKELIQKLHCDSSVATLVLFQQSKKYPFRQFTDSLTDEKLRENVIKALRNALPTYKGVTGKLRSPGGGGALPYDSDRGDCRKFCKEPVKVTEFCFVGVV